MVTRISMVTFHVFMIHVMLRLSVRLKFGLGLGANNLQCFVSIYRRCSFKEYFFLSFTVNIKSENFLVAYDKHSWNCINKGNIDMSTCLLQRFVHFWVENMNCCNCAGIYNWTSQDKFEILKYAELLNFQV